MSKKDLKKYLLLVSKKGYATNDERSWKKEKDGSTTISHQDGLWSMHDNYFGGEPYGGREVIFYDGKPVWIMTYYGEVSKDIKEVGSIYKFLQKALGQTDPETPLRGPKNFKEEDMNYKVRWSGDFFKFDGVETISKNGKEIYNAKFIGGLIDQREE